MHAGDNISLLDIGCHHGELLLKAKDKISRGVGIDPHVKTGNITASIKLINGMFPAALESADKFDCITALAVLEHIPANEQTVFMKACYDRLNKNGNLIITVPDAKVDKILSVLTLLRLVKGMSLEEHFGFKAATTPALAYATGFTMLMHEQFQFGLNNLFVFSKM